MGPIATRQAPNDEDRVLLQVILDATGLQCKWSAAAGFTRYDNGAPWNPLIDDGDALRLAVGLRMEVRIGRQNHLAIVSWGSGLGCVEEVIDSDAYAATRRAIVRAAAEIGRQRS